MSECAQLEMSFAEQDYDLDPRAMIPHKDAALYAHSPGSETFAEDSPDRPCRRTCAICGGGPVGALSDYGYADFTELDDAHTYTQIESGDWQAEPEIVSLCFGCARQILYDETDAPDPITGLRATDGIDGPINEYARLYTEAMERRGWD